MFKVVVEPLHFLLFVGGEVPAVKGLLNALLDKDRRVRFGF